MSNFDNEIKQRGENFSLQPRPEVWKRVEAELDKQNRGRIIGWWWLTPVVIIAWGFAFSFLERKDQKAFYNQDAAFHPYSEKTPAAPKNGMTQNRVENNKNDVITPSVTTPVTGVVNQKNKYPTTEGSTETAGIKSKPKQRKNVSMPANRQAAGFPGPSSKVNKNSEKSFNSQEDPAKARVTGKVVGTTPNEKQPGIAGKLSHPSNEDIESHTSQTLTAPDENSTSGKSTAPVSITSDQPTEQKAASHSNVNQSVAIGKAASPQKKKKSNWRLSIAGGMSINDSSVFKKRQKDSTDQSGGSTGGGGLIPEMEPHQPGFTISASLERVFNLGKRWQWKPGIIFQYQEIRQFTGDLQPYPVEPSPPDWDYSAYFYFDPGKTLEHKGNNFRIALGSDFSFSLFKNKPSLYLNAGVYGGYNIYNHFLLPDELQVWWIPSSSQYYNDLFGGVSAGIEYRFKKGAGIGITGRHDISQSYQPLRDKKYYWQSVLVQFSMPLNTTK